MYARDYEVIHVKLLQHNLKVTISTRLTIPTAEIKSCPGNNPVLSDFLTCTARRWLSRDRKMVYIFFNSSLIPAMVDGHSRPMLKFYNSQLNVFPFNPEKSVERTPEILSDT